MENAKTNGIPPAGQERAEDASADNRFRRAAKREWARTRRFLRAIWLTAGQTRRSLAAAVLVLSLLFNGLLIFSDVVQKGVAEAASVVGLRTVAARQANNIARTTAMLAAERDISRKTNAALNETRKE